MEIERRFYDVKKSADAGQKPKISGYAAKFGVRSEKLGWFREIIEPGAFAESLASDDIRALFNHDTGFVLGRNRSGTLVLSEDLTGLAMELMPPDTQMVRDLVLTPMDRGDITQMSFGFETISDRWETKNEEQIRYLEKVRLWEVSIVTFPAYPDTEAAVRSLDNYKKHATGRGSVGDGRIPLDIAMRKITILNFGGK